MRHGEGLEEFIDVLRADGVNFDLPDREQKDLVNNA